MGQKVNPISLRVGVIRTWDSRWYANADYAKNLHEDIKFRSYIQKSLKQAGVAKVEIERAAQKVKVIISTARPGVVIGKKGAGIDKIRLELQKFSKSEVFVSIQEVRKARFGCSTSCGQHCYAVRKTYLLEKSLEKSHSSIYYVAEFVVLKFKLVVSLDGAEIARSEWYNEKSVPLHTLRADIDYGTAEAATTYGILGVKVWIYRGDVLSMREAEEAGRA